MNILSFTSSPIALLGALILAGVVIFFLFRRHHVGTSSSSGGATPTLAQYCRDLTQQATDGKLDPVVGRDEEIERVIQVLSRRTKNNPVLVGQPGVGKTAIAEGLALAIASGQVPAALREKKVLALDLPGLISGTKYRGEFEQRLKRIADEITAAQRRIILFIDEIHTLAEAGGAEGAIDADDILKPALARGDLQVIGATTIEEYQQFIQKDVTLDRRLHPIIIDEPTPEETVMILEGIKRKYEQFHKVSISTEAIRSAVELSGKLVKDKFFPDKAIDLMDEAASKINIAHLDQSGNAPWPELTREAIEQVAIEWQRDQLKS
jgi:ATP-dependent Clp protease ATP-binding subunit ClpC